MTNVNTSGIRQVIAAQPKAIRQKNLLKRGNQGTIRKTTHTYEMLSESKNRIINIEPLKVFANQNLPRDHPLRKLLLAERSLLKPEEYIAKLESWLCLLRETK
jgi:hypothetical protein